jgi:formylglycine-generating enzyme required for sulfatase activity
MNNAIVTLRQMLSETAEVQRWWSLVEFLQQQPVEELSFLSEYVNTHIQSDPDWKRASVACGNWSKDSCGWGLSNQTNRCLTAAPFMEEIYCPPGTFYMGTPAEEDHPYCYDDERPGRKTTLKEGFWMLKTPVTQELWDLVMPENPSKFVHPQKPVEQASWLDAIDFCNALSKKEGLEPAYIRTEKTVKWQGKDNNGYRLPTEAEWEYACRAGSAAERYGDVEDIAWFQKNTSETQPVGQKEANAWGLHDMLGNVWEWCFELYNESAYRKPYKASHRILFDSGSLLIRGSAHNFDPGYARAASRLSILAHEYGHDTGFRIARNDV